MGIVLSLGATARADEIYPAFLSAVVTDTNHNGLTYHFFNNKTLISQCVTNEGITNLTGLSLVYDRTSNALEVVSGTNHTVVCTPLSFSGGLSLTNTNNTKVELLTFVFVETNSVAGGTLAATELIKNGTNGVVKAFNLSGQIQYTDGDSIIRGELSAGTPFHFGNEGRGDGGKDR